MLCLYRNLLSKYLLVAIDDSFREFVRRHLLGQDAIQF